MHAHVHHNAIFAIVTHILPIVWLIAIVIGECTSTLHAACAIGPHVLAFLFDIVATDPGIITGSTAGEHIVTDECFFILAFKGGRKKEKQMANHCTFRVSEHARLVRACACVYSRTRPLISRSCPLSVLHSDVVLSRSLSLSRCLALSRSLSPLSKKTHGMQD